MQYIRKGARRPAFAKEKPNIKKGFGVWRLVFDLQFLKEARGFFRVVAIFMRCPPPQCEEVYSSDSSGDEVTAKKTIKSAVNCGQCSTLEPSCIVRGRK